MKVVAIGGRSIFDRGRLAVMPLVDALLEARKSHEFVVGCSGGARLRHVYHVAMDLGLPTGALAQLAGPSEEQNVAMLQHLMARSNSCMLKREDFADMPLYLKDGFIPLVISVPPYHYWEPPPARGGRIPDYGSDFGMYITAEALGAAQCIFVKDQDGLYTDDPAINPDAEFIPKIGAAELLARDLPNLIIDRTVVESLLHGRFVRKVQIINGLKPELLGRALAGEHVGTIIYRED
jgi:molybdenum storage protein